MRIRKVVMERRVEEKIFSKHGVERGQIKSAFLGKPLFFRAKHKKYLAIAKDRKYITIVFKYKNGVANVVTAYPSSRWQAKLYKRKNG